MNLLFRLHLILYFLFLIKVLVTFSYVLLYLHCLFHNKQSNYQNLNPLQFIKAFFYYHNHNINFLFYFLLKLLGKCHTRFFCFNKNELDIHQLEVILSKVVFTVSSQVIMNIFILFLLLNYK